MSVYGAEEGYDVFAPYYDEGLGYLNSFEEGELFHMIGGLKGKRVLDIGAGTGRLVRELKDRGAEVVAADISEKMLDVLGKKFPDIETVVCDMKNLPFKDEEFDLVIATFVIVHIRDLTPAFDEVYRVLKDGGRFIVSNINQRKAPKLKAGKEKNLVIKSFYHMPKKVWEALEKSFFTIKKEEFVYDGKAWINQILEAEKRNY